MGQRFHPTGTPSWTPFPSPCCPPQAAGQKEQRAAAWAWAMPMEDLPHVNAGAAGTVSSLDTHSHPAGAPGSRAPPAMGPAGPCGQRGLGTSPCLLPWHLPGDEAQWPGKGSQGSVDENLTHPLLLPRLWRQPGNQRDTASSCPSLDEHPVPTAAVGWAPGSFPELIRKASASKAGFMAESPGDRLLHSMAVTALPRRGGGLTHAPHIAASGHTLPPVPPGAEGAALMMGDPQRWPLASCSASVAVSPWVRGGCALGKRERWGHQLGTRVRTPLPPRGDQLGTG